MRALSLANAAARGGAATLGGQVLRFLVQMASVVILARLIDPGDYGIYTMAFAVLGIATVIGDFGLSMAAIQSQTITQAQRSNLFWTNSLVGLILSAAAAAAGPALSTFYGDTRLTAISQALAVTFLLSAASAQFRAEATVRLRFGGLAIVDITAVTVGFVVALLIALHGFGYWALVSQQIALTSVTLIGMVIIARWRPDRPRRTAGMRPLYAYGLNTLGIQLLVYATSNVDSVLVGRFFGSAPLGVYDRAFRIFRLPLQQIAAPMTKVGVPILSKLQDDPRYNSYVQRGQLLLGYIFGGAFLVLFAVSSPLIDLLLGPGWDGAKPIFAALTIGGVFQGLGFVYAWVFLSKALTGLQLRWTIVGRTFMVAAICVGLIGGPVGVAIGASAGQAVNWALLTAFPMGRTGVDRRMLVWTGLRPVLLLAPVAVLCLVLSRTVFIDWNPLATLFLLVAIIGVYVASSLVLTPIRRDFAAMVSVVRRLKK